MTDAMDIPQPASPSPQPSAPVDLRLRGSPPRVMRLSRKAMVALGLGVCAGVGGSLIYALRPTVPRVAEELLATEGRATADGLAAAPKDYGQIPKLGPPLPGDLGRPILAAQGRGGDVPVPRVGAQPNYQATAADAARQHTAQERDAARTSRLFLGGAVATGASTDGATAGIAGLPGLQVAAAGATASPAEGAAQGSQAGKRAFLNTDVDRRTTSGERLAGLVSPYVVQAGTVIPVALITGIRSDLPGQITGQVTQNVYDSPTGRILLIPQGSRLIGEYDSEVSAGQNRVLLAWNRLILPGGRSIVLERQPGADAAGFAGLQDGVNYHWGNMAKAALISTLLGVGEELGAGSDDNLTRALRRGSQDTISQTGQQIVRQQLNVAPTLTIRPGFAVRVIVTRDLILEPIGGSR